MRSSNRWRQLGFNHLRRREFITLLGGAAVDVAQPSNLDTVIVDYRILKRQGKLTALDKRQVISEANAALTAIRKRANWW